jgi:hypothetical protein
MELGRRPGAGHVNLPLEWLGGAPGSTISPCSHSRLIDYVFDGLSLALARRVLAMIASVSLTLRLLGRRVTHRTAGIKEIALWSGVATTVE